MSLCIFAMATKKYLRYMPLFTYFCFKSYPKCGVRILLLNCGLDHAHIKIIKTLKRMGDLKIRTMTGYPKASKQESKMLRWMMDEGFFKPYENIYITDIDILICQERIPLEKYHLRHCEKMKLPYSSIVRSKAGRLTGGMHFFRRREYYRATANVIVKYSRLLKEGKLIGYGNEEILYKIIGESGLRFPTGLSHVHHGIHLGLWRMKEDGKVLKAFKAGNVSVLENYGEYLPFYWALRRDSLFRRINEDHPLEELGRMEEWVKREWNMGKRGNI